MDFNPDETTIGRYNKRMSKKQNEKKSSVQSVKEPEGSAVSDFAEEEKDFSEISEFDRAMRGLIGVKKSELHKALRKKRSKNG